MAFNREDLITWSELSTSLQNIIKNAQDSITEQGEKIAENTELLNQLQEQVDANESELTNLGSGSNTLKGTVTNLYNFTEGQLLRAILETRAKFEFHKLDPNAHSTSLNTIVQNSSNKRYSIGSKIIVSNLHDLLEDDYNNDTISEYTGLGVNYSVGSGSAPNNVDYEVKLQEVLTAQINNFLTVPSERVILALKDLYRDIFNHIYDDTAHDFNTAVFTTINNLFMFEKGYKVLLPSANLAMLGIDHISNPKPSYSEPNITEDNQYSMLIRLEKSLQDHLVSVDDHGLNSATWLFGKSKVGYDLLTLASPLTQTTWSLTAIARDNTVPGGPDGVNVVCGITHTAFGKWVQEISDGQDNTQTLILDQLADLKATLLEHEESLDAHPGSRTSFLLHKTDTVYAKGDIVRDPTMPNNFALQAVTDGEKTAKIKPTFYAGSLTIEEELANEIDRLRAEIEALKANATELSQADIANRLTQIMQDYLDHTYDYNAHPNGTTSCLTHTAKHRYLEGEVVRVPKFTSNFSLQATNEGTTFEQASASFYDPQPSAPDATPCPTDGLNQYINSIKQAIQNHEEDTDPHRIATGSAYMFHNPDTYIEEGTIVYYRNIPTYYKLEAQNSGYTSPNEPNITIQ